MEPADERRDDRGLPGSYRRRVRMLAAMEPGRPSAGRRRPQRARLRRSTVGPQWSPPTSGGTTWTALGTGPGRSPQWSPPTSGGTTPQDRSIVRPWSAAMEPAGQRRDDRQRGAPRFGDPRSAAMEPAGHRRDDLAVAAVDRRVAGCRNGARRPSAGRPLARDEPCRNPRGRNGARRPSAGRPAAGPEVRRAHAAMEPAGDRRDDRDAGTG